MKLLKGCTVTNLQYNAPRHYISTSLCQRICSDMSVNSTCTVNLLSWMYGLLWEQQQYQMFIRPINIFDVPFWLIYYINNMHRCILCTLLFLHCCAWKKWRIYRKKQKYFRKEWINSLCMPWFSRLVFLSFKTVN